MTSPLPWKINRGALGIFITSGNCAIASTMDIRTSSDCRASKISEANASFIVHCVNNHEKLVDALRTMLVATDFNVPLPEGHPGHEAYLNVVAIPRAKQALQSAEDQK